MTDIKAFRARKILTMDPNLPEATHVAIRNGRVLAVGGLREISAWGDVEIDDRYVDQVLMPGFVEGHAHVMAGAVWDGVYVGHFDQKNPSGEKIAGVKTTEEAIARLKAEADKLSGPEKPLFGWGIDPIFLEGRRLDRHHLDEVSGSRPVVVMHSSFHLLTANTPALKLAQYEKGTNLEGVVLEEDGTPAGEIQEMAAMFPILRRLNIDFAEMSRDEGGIRAYGEIARNAGVTTVTDLFAELEEEDVSQLLKVTGSEGFPVRLVPAMNALGGRPEDVTKRALALAEKSTPKLRLGIVKVMTDGSIQGFTAQVKEPGYFKGPNNGIWNISPEQLRVLVAKLHASGVHMHIHTNGDLASEVTLDALEAALKQHPAGDHRHTLQHVQMAGRAQFRRMAKLGVCANLFANHIYYFGDKHYELTIGPDRANRMDACGDALALGVPLAIHCDAPITPMAPLFTAWCAVNRHTQSGRVLGENQRISVADALYAITLGAAYTLKMDDEIGSIECGKRADFVVLGDDPLSVSPIKLKDVPVMGTVLDGEPTK